MFVDMGQADASLYPQASPRNSRSTGCAIDLAAKEMGYTHFMDVPDAELDSLESTARRDLESEGG